MKEQLYYLYRIARQLTVSGSMDIATTGRILDGVIDESREFLTGKRTPYDYHRARESDLVYLRGWVARGCRQ